MRLVDADAIYKQVQEAEELARDRVIDTKWTLPYQNHINPAYTRYHAQVGERTWMKHMIANAPTVDAVPVVRCKGCKYWDAFPSSTLAPDHHECKRIRIHTTAEWFCAAGERKDGEHETD